MLGKSIMLLTTMFALGISPAAAQTTHPLGITAVEKSVDALRMPSDTIGSARATASIPTALNARAAEASFSMPQASLLMDEVADASDAGGVNSLVAQESLGRGRNVAFMVVGGAAVVTGLLVGGDAGTLISVGGAVLGLYGLYMYVR